MGNFDWKGWSKTIAYCVFTFIMLAVYMGGWAKDTSNNKEWISRHKIKTDSMTEFIHSLDNSIGIMDERIKHMQDDLKMILREMKK